MNTLQKNETFCITGTFFRKQLNSQSLKVKLGWFWFSYGITLLIQSHPQNPHSPFIAKTRNTYFLFTAISAKSRKKEICCLRILSNKIVASFGGDFVAWWWQQNKVNPDACERYIRQHLSVSIAFSIQFSTSTEKSEWKRVYDLLKFGVTSKGFQANWKGASFGLRNLGHPK